ncbi:hypothetical protein E2542_SST02075 [Spatholobus suberectus]|nr:hypothetical protein E2542_SST02075 [Spatholobus suberectus]
MLREGNHYVGFLAKLGAKIGVVLRARTNAPLPPNAVAAAANPKQTLAFRGSALCFNGAFSMSLTKGENVETTDDLKFLDTP